MRVLTIGGIVVFAVLAAVLLANTVGQRRPGQQITGDAQVDGIADHRLGRRRDRGGQGGRRRPRRRATTPASATPARSYVARRVPGRDPGVHRGREARPDAGRAPRVHGLAHRALRRAGDRRDDASSSCFDAATSSLDQAIAVDPTYPDSYVFKGLLLAQIENKQCDGAVAFQQFLVIAPDDHPLRQQVLSALAEAVKAGNCPSPPTTPTTKP